MQKANLYIKDWLSIHPYTRQQPSDNYFVQLANRLFHICPLNEIPEAFKKKICLYTAAYLEDVISELGLWRSFVNKHSELHYLEHASESSLPTFLHSSDDNFYPANCQDVFRDIG